MKNQAMRSKEVCSEQGVVIRGGGQEHWPGLREKLTGAEWMDTLNEKPDPECLEPRWLRDNSVSVLE